MQTCTEVSQWLCTQVQQFCWLSYEANNGNPEGVGFGPKWKRLIYACISTTQLSILVNGAPTRRVLDHPCYSSR